MKTHHFKTIDKASSIYYHYSITVGKIENMLVAAGSAHTDGSSNSNNVKVESFRHGAWTAQPDYPHENTKIGMYSAVTIGNELWYFGKNLTPRGCEI